MNNLVPSSNYSYLCTTYYRMKNRKSHTRKEKGGLFALLLALVGIGTTGCWQICK